MVIKRRDADDPPAYLPAGDPSLITVTQVLNAVSIAGEEHLLSPRTVTVLQPVAEAMDRVQQAVESSVGDISLRDLVTNNIDPLEHDSEIIENY